MLGAGWALQSLRRSITVALTVAVASAVAVSSALVGGGVSILLTHLLNRAGVGIDHRAKGRA